MSKQTLRRCERCGCSEKQACPSGCSWIMEGVDICTGCLSATENEAFQHWRGYRDAAAGVGRLQLHWFRELERLLDQRRKNIRTIQSALRKEAA